MLASAWLDDADDMELVGVAQTGNGGVVLASRLLPQVVLLDHLLPDADSSTLVSRLREDAPGVAIPPLPGIPTALRPNGAWNAVVEAFCSKAREPSGFLTIVREARAVANG